jgi:hypothetical protein
MVITIAGVVVSAVVAGLISRDRRRARAAL